jgi:hypothetical protein
VGYSTIDSNPDNFIWTDRIEYVVTAGWVEYNKELPGETKFIAIEYLTMFNWYVYIDDITIDALVNNDVAVTAILSPQSGANLTDAETVTVEVKNNGTQVAPDIPIKFEIDGVVKGEEVVLGPVAKQTTVSYTFETKADLHELKRYTLKAYTTWSDDTRPDNDTVSVKVTNFGDCVASLPLAESFEDVSDLACWTIGYDPGKENRPETAQIARTGKQSWAFSSRKEDSDQFLMTPELPVGSDKPKSVQFYVNNPTHAIETVELFQIGYSTTDKEISGFSWSNTFGVGFTNGWIEFIAPSIPAGAKYICIHYFSGDQDRLYIDDLIVREISEVDVALTALIAPVSGNDLSAKEKVTVNVRNTGTTSVSDVPVAFELNGTLARNGMVSGSIAPSQEKTFIFDATVDLSTVNTYTIKAYTGLSGDMAHDNDTLSVQITNTGICKVTDFPYTEGFENPFGSCWSFYNLDGNFYEWERSKLLARTGDYSAYHGGGPGSENGWMVSPKIAIPADRSLALYFWTYNAFSVGEYGKNSVWISTGSPDPNSGDFVEIWTPSDPVPYEWEEAGLNLGNYKGKDIYIAFRYQGYLSHTCLLDDISIIDISDRKDVGLTAITYPTLNSGDMGRETVKIRVKNFGGQPLINLPVKFEVNGKLVANENIPETIAPLQEIAYYFKTPVDLSQKGTYTIKVYTVLEGDANARNDEASVTVTNYGVCEVSSFPYLEDFERETDYFICWNVYNLDEDDRTWTPASVLGEQIIPAHSGNLVALHDGFAYEDGWLVSPKINIPSEDIYQLSFWTFTAWPDWYIEEENNAKSSVWISTGNANPASGDFKEVWSAKTVVDEWKEVKLNLRKYAGQSIYIAFRYEGEAAHAWFLDDVSVYELTGLDTGISEIIMPAAGEVTAATPVKVKITNFGAVPLTSVPVAYVCNNEAPVMETFTGNILSGDSVEYTFTQPLDMSRFGFYRLKAYTSLLDDSDASNNEVSLLIAYPQDIELYGYRLYSTDFNSVNDFRAVKFSLYNPSILTNVGNPYVDSENNIVVAGEYFDKKIYAFTRNYEDASPGYFVRLSSNWEEDGVKTPVTQTPIDMTYDYYNETMYAITSAGSSSLPVTLKEVNLSTGELTTVVELDYYLYTLAANLQGDLYGVDVDGYLVTVDKQSGVTRVINNLGIYPDGNQSMTFDHNSDPERLFWAMYISVYEQGRLIEIDPVSGKSFSSGPIGEDAQIVALYTPYSQDVKINHPESDIGIIRIYPNPAQEVVYLTSVPEKSQIRILDLSGRTVFSDDKQSGKVTLNLNLKAGAYLVVIENENEKAMRKLIIK